ncbi:hypothetical protein, conserved in T.vivax [Trypanosoma vivax Y486]|uniref:Retrotransposon hot spot (RHS) protein n=1 Tax=Trypanosoma vivax (strain Y486) TaxID=1055687 RepID=F9WPR9_TRYVY|nr:hypothetical protein, conserved in T.vivax [Trypanosoma vivax Y486]|eukprot:CCD19546.1 hypothetical protein, conserved in T.vivax [Trypanosoma vivax Y486]
MLTKETQKLRMQTSTELVREIPVSCESVLNAKCCLVVSGEAGMPFFMCVVDGLPENFWSYDEVNYSPWPLEVNRQAPRNGRLEITVVSSEDGWPYTRLKNETASVDNNAGIGRGGVLNAPTSNYVYIRREVVRVWYLVEKAMRAWYIERKLAKPRTCIVIGTPGIGKSFSCGSFLLHQLVHYDGGVVDVVAYFVSKYCYVIHNARPGVPGRVVKYSDKRAAVSKINEIASCKSGFVIVDISKKGQFPPEELSTKSWPTAVLTPPDVNHYEQWVKDREW